MDGSIQDLLAGGGVLGVLLALGVWLVRKSGTLVFAKDETGFRRDLMELLEQERDAHRAVVRELEDSRREMNELTSEVMRLQVMLETMRQQYALTLRLLQQVRDGTLPVDSLTMPDLPISSKGD